MKILHNEESQEVHITYMNYFSQKKITFGPNWSPHNCGSSLRIFFKILNNERGQDENYINGFYKKVLILITQDLLQGFFCWCFTIKGDLLDLPKQFGTSVLAKVSHEFGSLCPSICLFVLLSFSNAKSQTWIISFILIFWMKLDNHKIRNMTKPNCWN